VEHTLDVDVSAFNVMLRAREAPGLLGVWIVKSKPASSSTGTVIGSEGWQEATENGELTKMEYIGRGYPPKTERTTPIVN